MILRTNDANQTQRLHKVICIWAVLIILGLVLGAVLNHWNLYLPCIFRTITGLKCPGCGITRMSMAIMRLDFVSAFHYNPVIFLMLPIIFITLINLSVRYIIRGTMAISKKWEIVIVLMIIILVAFGIIRNII